MCNFFMTYFSLLYLLIYHIQVFLNENASIISIYKVNNMFVNKLFEIYELLTYI